MHAARKQKLNALLSIAITGRDQLVLAASMNTWQSNAMDLRRERFLIRPFMQRLSHGHRLTAWQAWKAFAADSCRRRLLLGICHCRLQNRLLSASWSTWRDLCLAKARLKSILQICAARSDITSHSHPFIAGKKRMAHLCQSNVGIYLECGPSTELTGCFGLHFHGLSDAMPRHLSAEVKNPEIGTVQEKIHFLKAFDKPVLMMVPSPEFTCMVNAYIGKIKTRCSLHASGTRGTS